MHRLQLALCGGGGAYIAQTLYLHLGWLLLAACTGGLVPSSTCTYTACVDCNLHCDDSGGIGVMEGVPWDSSMWWLYVNIIIFGHVTL